MTPAQKINIIVDSLKKNSERLDLKNWVIQSIEEDENFDRSETEAVTKLLNKMEGKFKVSNWKKAGDIWKELLNFKKEEGDTPKKYLEKFNLLETKIRNARCKVSNILLAQHFLQRANLNAITVQNILSKVDTEDDEKVLKQTKESFDILVNSHDGSVNTTFYGDRFRSGSKKPFEKNRRDRSQSESRRGNQRDGRDGNRGRTRSRSIGFRERGRSRSRSKGREFFKQNQNRRSGNEDFRAHTAYKCEKFDLPDCDFSKNPEELNIFRSETENKAIVDSGCPKTVAGKLWFSVYRDSLKEMKGTENLKYNDEKHFFKFGPSSVYEAKQSVELPIKIGNQETCIRVSLVNANVPFLLGKDYLKKWRCKQDYAENTMTFGITGETVKLKETPVGGHYYFELIEEQEVINKEINEAFFTQSDDEKYKKLKKIHRITAHKLEEPMCRFIQHAGMLDKETKEFISDIIKKCKVCRMFSKTKDTPKVGMPKAQDTNEVVALDLKELRNDKVLSDKNPSTVLRALEDSWVHRGPGWPGKGFFSDRGGEFDNKEMRDYARKLGISLRITPSYSPWANGSNKRNHYTVDRAVSKVRTDDPTIALGEAVHKACFWKNADINKKGFSSQQLMFGRGAIIPGISDGSVATDEPAVGSKSVHQIFARHMNARDAAREADNSNRIKLMLKSRIPDYVDRFYKRGDRVFVKDRNSDIWLGPYTVQYHENKNVVVKRDNYEVSFPTNRVIPEYDEKNELERDPVVSDSEETVDENDKMEVQEASEKEVESEVEKEIDDNFKPSEARPKKGKNIKYKLNLEDDWKEGKVVDIGKASGKDKNRCWILDEDKITKHYDFLTEVETWKYKNILFAEEARSNEREDANEMRGKEAEMEAKGVSHMFYTNRFGFDDEDLSEDDFLKNVERVVTVLATEVKKSEHNSPEVIDAKNRELENYVKFDAFEEVEDEGQTRITTRWVVTRKEDHDGMKVKTKARLCMRGFQEEVNPQSDSPTIAKESLKVMLAVSANEDFSTVNLDATNAFLQGKEITREVFAEPPKEMKRPGILWKLKKSCYGLYDGSRNWFLAVKKELEKLGCKQVTGEEALFSKHNDEGLEGLVCLHVDDFICSGKEKFHSEVTEKIQGKFTFGKKEEGSFRFTGLDLKEKEEEIVMNQNHYCESIDEIEIEDKTNTDRELTREEYKAFRGITGKLSWLQEQTRPDLSFDSLLMSMKNKHATVADINKINKIVRKAKKEECAVKFSKIDDFKNLKIIGFGDASYKTTDEKTRSVEGRVIFLSNGKKASPLLWKSRKIVQVCESTKTAETRAADKLTDDSIYLARMVQEIYTGNKSLKQLPVLLYTDSEPLVESIYSTKAVERKTIRHVVQSMKDSLSRGEVMEYRWIDTKKMLADILTKESVKSDELVHVLRTGHLPREY